MSPTQARVRTLYLLVALNLVLLLVSVALTVYVRDVADRLSQAEQRNYAGCVRGNVLREGYRFAMEKLGSPERAAQPEVKRQPCDLIYPGGVPSNRKGEP